MSLYPFEPKNAANIIGEADAHALSTGFEFCFAQIVGSRFARALPKERQEPAGYCPNE